MGGVEPEPDGETRRWSLPWRRLDPKRIMLLGAAAVLVAAGLAVTAVAVRSANGCAVRATSIPSGQSALDLGNLPPSIPVPRSTEFVSVSVGQRLVIRDWATTCVPVTVTMTTVPSSDAGGRLHELGSGHMRSEGRIGFFAVLLGVSPGSVSVHLQYPVRQINCRSDEACPALLQGTPTIPVRVARAAP